MFEILQLVRRASSFPRVLYKRGDLKNFSKFSHKYKKQSSESVLSKDVLKNFTKFTEKNMFCGVSFLTKLQAINLKLAEVTARVLKSLQILQEKKNLFLIKLEFWGSATLLKKTPTQVFSCEIYKLFKNNYFKKRLWTSASKRYLKRDSNTAALLWIL